MNGLFPAALAVMIVRSAARVLMMPNAGHADWLLMFCGAFVADWGLDVQASSYSTDIGVAVVSIVARIILSGRFRRSNETRKRFCLHIACGGGDHGEGVGGAAVRADDCGGR